MKRREEEMVKREENVKYEKMRAGGPEECISLLSALSCPGSLLKTHFALRSTFISSGVKLSGI